MKEHIISLILSISLITSFICLNKGVKSSYRTFKSVVIPMCSFMSMIINAILIRKKSDHNIVYTLAISLIASLCDFIILYCTMESMKVHSIAFILLAFIGFCVSLFLLDRHVSLITLTINSLMIVVLFMFEVFEYNGVQLHSTDLEIAFLKPYMSMLFIIVLVYGFRMVLVHKFSGLIEERPFVPLCHNIFLMIFAVLEASFDSFADLKVFYSEISHCWVIVLGSLFLLPTIFLSSQNTKWVQKETFLFSLAVLITIVTCFYVVSSFDYVFGKNRLEMLGSWCYASLLLVFTITIFFILFYKKRLLNRAAAVSNVEIVGADVASPTNEPPPAGVPPEEDLLFP
ncbi:putative transporter [Trachipleistophora hominis]|uniref:Putative transporter n=1 Tax=Trachipleistophora hominis TaxID=72359 RepID=L7K070_TRAHO|nr:putative transporter [Trachipleistophora hominis]